ncbi:hypothetical protein ONZ43_g111 [Nemania bipapillata]|uniref:Uncharacterized protein n=1 Tax=Nemania bipapillata TaxID=110536 RepID=A0ACC2J9T2_9PEZI|nr:hypothetical protein ONZ43_g111 [Nemania bipapillata]
MSTLQFRFMDLPQEIKDLIYKFILCTFERKVHYIEDIDRRVYSHPKFDTSILLANRQISRDAFDIFLKQNLFVKVVFLRCTVPSYTWPLQVPIVASGKSVVTAFKGHVMSHFIEMTSWPEEGFDDAESRLINDWYLLMRWQDLSHFCQNLATSGIKPFNKTSAHRVEIHNPFAGTSSANYLNAKKQAHLLKPYREHFRGFTSFSVVGNVEPSLAAAVTQEVKEEPRVQDPHDFLRDMHQRKELGNKYFNDGDTAMASQTWGTAFLALMRLAWTPQWSSMKAQAGPDSDWTYGIADIFFRLSSNLVASALRVVHEEAKKDVRLAPQHVGSVELPYWYCYRCSWFENSWRQTIEQERNLNYRIACAHRIGGSPVCYAKEEICTADDLSPDDPLILKEMEKIAKWQEVSELCDASGQTPYYNWGSELEDYPLE